jgi:hypothetical protein
MSHMAVFDTNERKWTLKIKADETVVCGELLNVKRQQIT